MDIIEANNHAFLVALVKKQAAQLDAVRELAASWELQGERDMAFSKTIRNEDISITFLAEGAAKVENARMIHAAITALEAS